MASKVIYSVVAVLGIAAASGAAWWYQAKPSKPTEITGSASGMATSPAAVSSAPRAAGVEVARVERVMLRDDAQSVGSLRSRQSVMMRPEVPGRVSRLGFLDGASVRKGQLLVQLDDALQRAEIKQASAQVSIAKANYRRNQELVQQGFVAQRVLDESSANLQVAEAQLSLSCARLARMAIVAPFDGTVGIRNVNLGDFVKDGADLVNLEDIGTMYVDFRMPERFQTKLKLRQPVELQLDAMPGRLFRATIEAIDPLLDVNGRSVGVRAVLPNTPGEPLAARGARGSGAAATATARPASAPGDARATASVRPPASPRGTAAPGASRAARGRPAAGASGAEPPKALAAMDGCPDFVAPILAGPGGGAPSPALAQMPLRPGMFARVTTVFAVNDRALTVPEEAIVPQGGRQFVIKVVEPGAVPGVQAGQLPPETRFVSLRQEVKLGARQLGRVEITEGVGEGDTVVIAGQQRLQRDGSPLRIVELGRPGGGAQGGGAGPAGAASAASAPASTASR